MLVYLLVVDDLLLMLLLLLFGEVCCLARLDNMPWFVFVFVCINIVSTSWQCVTSEQAASTVLNGGIRAGQKRLRRRTSRERSIQFLYDFKYHSAPPSMRSQVKCKLLLK